MATGALITALSILLATYSMLPEEKRLDIKIRISILDACFVLSLIVGILIVVYSPVILTVTQMRPIPWIWGFNAELASFTFLLGILVFAGWKLFSSKIPTSCFQKWSKESEQLLRERKFSQLGYLLNKYHEQLYSVVKHEVWYVRYREKISPKINLLSLYASGEELVLEKEGDLVVRVKDKYHDLKKWIVNIIPDKSMCQEEVRVSISKLLKSRLFVSYLAESYPMIGAKATSLRLPDDDEFRTYFFEALISNPHSILYRELKDAQNIPFDLKYDIDQGNQLLSYFFTDANVAKNVSIWQPIGNWVKAYINEKAPEKYNQSNDYYSDTDERWESPIYIASRFFYVMVTAAICQRVKDHMWLMYIDRFVGVILENLNRKEGVDLNREFPTRFDYEIYNLFSICDDWLDLIQSIDIEGVSYNDLCDYPEFWAAQTMGQMLRRILRSDKMTNNQKTYFLDIIVRRVSHLENTGCSFYGDLVLDGCLKDDIYAGNDQHVIDEMKDAFNNLDQGLFFEKDTFKLVANRRGAGIP